MPTLAPLPSTCEINPGPGSRWVYGHHRANLASRLLQRSSVGLFCLLSSGVGRILKNATLSFIYIPWGHQDDSQWAWPGQMDCLGDSARARAHTHTHTHTNSRRGTYTSAISILIILVQYFCFRRGQTLLQAWVTVLTLQVHVLSVPVLWNPESQNTPRRTL